MASVALRDERFWHAMHREAFAAPRREKPILPSSTAGSWRTAFKLEACPLLVNTNDGGNTSGGFGAGRTAEQHRIKSSWNLLRKSAMPEAHQPRVLPVSLLTVAEWDSGASRAAYALIHNKYIVGRLPLSGLSSFTTTTLSFDAFSYVQYFPEFNVVVLGRLTTRVMRPTPDGRFELLATIPAYEGSVQSASIIPFQVYRDHVPVDNIDFEPSSDAIVVAVGHYMSQVSISLIDTDKCVELSLIKVPSNDRHGVTGLQWVLPSPTRQNKLLLATACIINGGAHLWDVRENSSFLFTRDFDAIDFALVLSTLHHWRTSVIAVSTPRPFDDEAKINFWNLDRARKLNQVLIPKFGEITAMSAIAQGGHDIILAGSSTGLVAIISFKMTEQVVLRLLRLHSGPIFKVRFAGGYLVSTSRKSLKVWKMAAKSIRPVAPTPAATSDKAKGGNNANTPVKGKGKAQRPAQREGKGGTSGGIGKTAGKASKAAGATNKNGTSDNNDKFSSKFALLTVAAEVDDEYFDSSVVANNADVKQKEDMELSDEENSDEEGASWTALPDVQVR